MNRKALLAAGAAGLAAAVLFRPRRSWSFAGKVVLITGGSRGLGLLLARQLAAEGARLALVARNEEDLRRAAAELRGRGHVGRHVRGRGAEVLELPADVGDQEQLEGAVESAIRHYGRLDVLINNAGVIQVGPTENMALTDFEEALNVHFWGPRHASGAAAI